MHTQQANIFIKKLLKLYQNTLLLHTWYTSETAALDKKCLALLKIFSA